VPATSANLGPGFDALGLALALYDEVEASIAPDGVTLDVTGEGADEVADAGEKHLIVRAMRAAFDDLGSSQPPGITLRCVNRIPHGRGLGSSAAAIVAGVLAARALTGADVTPDAALPLANELEGHPDNVAPCLFGGLTIAWISQGTGGASGGSTDPGLPRAAASEDLRGRGEPGGREERAGLRGEAASTAASPSGPGGLGGLVSFPPGSTARAIRLETLPGITPVAIIAPKPVSTEVARDLLPAHVPHADAARNAGRSALLVAALTARPDALLDATEDLLHQDYRAPAMPETHHLVRCLRVAGIPAVVSGAGPSVLAFLGAGTMGRDRLDSTVLETGIGWHVSPLDVERQGASVTPVVPSAR
jgi:homoserine kinase